MVREIGDHLGDLPYQLVQVALLPLLAVDLQRDEALGGVADLGGGDDRAHRRAALEGLADLPRAAEFLRLALQVAAGHVEADRVSEYAVERALDRDVHAALVQGHHHLDLVMHVRGLRRVGEFPREIEVVGVLLEEERRLAVRVVPHLDGVGGVVAADAVDAAHGEGLGRDADGRENRRGRGDDGVGHAVPFGRGWGRRAAARLTRV
jgi:hypothetical protein